MFNIGPLELMLLLVMALIVFGPAKLPELMASVGHAIREFQRASRELTEVFQETQQEFSSALDLDQTGTATEATEYAANGATADELSQTVPVTYEEPAAAPVNVTPDEYDTAAGMVDPVEAYPAPAAPEPEPAPAEAQPIAVTPDEYGTAAGLVDGAPVELAPAAVAVVAKPRRPRKKPEPHAASEPATNGAKPSRRRKTVVEEPATEEVA